MVANVYAINGTNPSNHAGDFQYFSNIANDFHVEQLGQLFYEQYLFDEQVPGIKLGKTDANAEFAIVQGGLEFVSSSASFQPDDLRDAHLPRHPATCVSVFFDPNEHWHLGAGVFDGATIARCPPWQPRAEHVLREPVGPVLHRRGRLPVDGGHGRAGRALRARRLAAHGRFRHVFRRKRQGHGGPVRDLRAGARRASATARWRASCSTARPTRTSRNATSTSAPESRSPVAAAARTTR